MKNAHRAEDTSTELDVLEILRELFRWKWLILGVTLLAGAAAAVISISKPDIYESSAALIVREPQIAITRDSESPDAASDQAPALSVETLQMLADSTETVRNLFDTLWDKKLLKSWPYDTANKEDVFPGFQRALSSEVKRQQSRRTGTSVELLPILILSARAVDPGDAQVIANEWAGMVETKSGSVYTQGVAARDAYIGNMYKQSNESLARLEKDLAMRALEAGVELKRGRLENLFTKIAELEGIIFDLDIELAVNAVAVSEGTTRIREQEHEGEWIGSVAEAASATGEAYPFETEGLSDRASRILDLAKKKAEQMADMRAYQLEQNFLGKQSKFKHLQSAIERILADKAKAEDDLPPAEDTLAALVKSLETVPETLTLDKAITDDALWEAAVNNPGADIAKLGALKTEILNPTYASTKERIIEATARIEALRGNTTQLAKSAETAAAESEALANEIDRIQRELDRRENALKDTDTTLLQLREEYLGEIKRVEEFKALILRKRAEKATREERLDAFEQETKSVEADIAAGKLDLDMLAREVEKTKNVRGAIAAKAEETALLQVTAENATRTGTTILYSAKEDPTSLKQEGKLVLASMFFVFLICSVIVCAARVVRTAK